MMVDRGVPTAIARMEYRAGTSRSTLPEGQNHFVIGINRSGMDSPRRICHF